MAVGPAPRGASGVLSRRIRLGAVALAAAVPLLAVSLWLGTAGPTEMPLSELARLAKRGQIARVTVADDTWLVERAGGVGASRVRVARGAEPYDTLEAAGVPRAEADRITIAYGAPSGLGTVGDALLLAAPVAVLGAALLWLTRRSRASGDQVMSFGRSPARRLVGAKTGVTFGDVAGVDEAKQELQEVVECLRDPGKFAALGARLPRGVLLTGPPGTGKTLLARAVAGEAGVPFFSISGAAFVELFVGVGASRARDLFEQAKKNAPCVVFVDEIDAVGRRRGGGMGGGNDEREQTLNQILVEMDGFDTDTNVVVVAATNRPDVLDPALLRPGRFDRQVVLDEPDVVGRAAVLAVHSRGKPLDGGVDVHLLARQTPGFSGADLASLLNEAAILAARRGLKAIGRPELEEAIDRVVAGPERRSRVISEREKAVIAYHEGGHAVTARYLEHLAPLHKVTIVARGTMGGYTRLLPVEERHLRSRSELEDDLVFTLGGRVAEELVFAEVTTGAGQDIEQATRLARRMVAGLGMSRRLGPVALGRRAETVFLGRGFADARPHSERTARALDEEVRALIDGAAGRARDILVAHRGALDRLARQLVERETVSGEELEAVFLAPDRPEDG